MKKVYTKGKYRKAVIVWKIIENIRSFLIEKHQKKIKDKEIAEELNMCRVAMINAKRDNRESIILYVVNYCVQNDLQLNIFINKDCFKDIE